LFGPGLDTNKSTADYVQSHGGDKATLAESLAAIQQTASAILQAIDPSEDTRQMGNQTQSNGRISPPSSSTAAIATRLRID
jgi:hypothetical protein